MDISALRAKSGNQFDAMRRQAETMNKKSGYGDQRFWKPKPSEPDSKTGAVTARCRIRLMPIPVADYKLVEEGKITEDQLTPIAKVLYHNFKGVNGYYRENSLRTFGEACPILEHDGPMWGSFKKQYGKESPQYKTLTAPLKDRLPKEQNIVGIYVELDTNNPENEGKTFLYDLPKAILKLIDDAQTPAFADDPVINAFSLFEDGAFLEFRLKYEEKTFPNSTKPVQVPDYSEGVKWGEKQCPVGDSALIERIWNEGHSIAEHLDRSKFKSYDELKAKFLRVIGEDEGDAPATPGAKLGDSAADFLASSMKTKTEPEAGASKEAPAPAASKEAEVDDLDEMFKMLGA